MCYGLGIIFMLGGAVAAYVIFKAASASKRKSLSSNKLYVAEHYGSQEFLNDLKREITDTLREFGRRIDRVFHPNRD
jgi:hypothetical protein